MDEDDYNAIETADFLGNEEPLSYGEDGHMELAVCAIDELNNLERRARKRPMGIENSDPIDWHMRVPCSMDEANELREKEETEKRIMNRLVERILQARKRKRFVESIEEERREEGGAEAEAVVLQLPPTDGSPWIGVSAPDFGQRYYLRLRKFPVIGSSRRATSTKSWDRLNCLNSRPIGEILESAHHELQSHMEERSMEMEELCNSIISPVAQTQLWVEKYAPRTFVDLVSDDRVNRLLLKWLKLWDECVFKRRIVDSMLNTTDESEFISVDNGKPRRPLQKVVLIAGAAGLGKTTLAGVVARHCGYRVVEMNASDDRNVLAFERKIEGAIRAVRTLDADSRPNCLVVDEIDGAPVESIRYLCKTLALTGRKAIRRPIICICNNLYVQTLRELRSVALVLQMPHTEQYRLERRLQQIADSEHVRIEAGAIAEIVSICALDMRSSINALQFIAIEKGCDVIGLNAVRTYGDRETRMGEKSLFDMWAYVFEMRRHIDNRGRLLDVPLRVRRVTALCQRFSTEFEKFHLGLFANYLSSGSECHRISSISAAARSFCDYDILSKLVLQSQNYELMKYTFVFIVQLHLLLASQERINLVFPTADQTCSQQRRQSVETLLSVRSGAAEKVIPERALVLDLLPMLVIIVQPPLKPMNMQLYSDRELNMLRAVVAVMRSYSLTFAATFHDGVTSFTFCPPVDTLVLFPLEDCERRRANFLSNSVRQMIAHQIELNKLRSDVVQSEKENGRRIEQESVSGKGATGNRSVTAAYELSQYNSSNRGRGIVYRYNQGFSNAIRRNIRMKNLIF